MMACDETSGNEIIIRRSKNKKNNEMKIN